jgi:LytR cell envelope-related transcriptional attenuator
MDESRLTSRRGRVLVVALLVMGVGAGSFAVWFRATHPTGPVAVRERDVPGQGERVVVEVLNGTGGVGLARAATRVLRDAGLDVVYFGSDSARTLDSTQILVRRGAMAPGERVQRALGVGSVRSAPDPARLVDVTVRLGADFTARLRNP